MTRFQKMARLFGPKGKHWCKGKRKVSEGGVDKYCLLGAASKVSGRLVDGIVAEAYRKLHPIGGAVWMFNDAPSTRFSSIKKFLKDAIRLGY